MSALSDTSNVLLRDVEAEGDVRDDPHWRALVGEDPVKAFLAQMAAKHLHGLHDQSTHGRRGGAARRIAAAADGAADAASSRPARSAARRTGKPAPGPKPSWEQRIASGQTRVRRLTDDDNTNVADLVEFGDGSKAVRKKAKSRGRQRPAKAEFDAEELGAKVSAVLGLDAPDVHRAAANEAYFSYVHDKDPNAAVGAQVGIGGIDLKSADARRIGLLDTLIENGDRNDGNWFAANPAKPSAKLIPIDHGNGWDNAARGYEPDEITWPNSFQRYLFQSSPRSMWLDNDLSPRYLSGLRAKLEALAPEFERLGRKNWHKRMLARLDIVASHAKGTVTL